MMPQRRPLILASRSPRRLLLLREAGFAVEVRPSGIDEAALMPDAVVSIDDLTCLLARHKARAVAADANASAVVLAADTLVEADGSVIGQPADRADAERIIRALADRWHRVVTGVAIIDAGSGKETVFADSSEVDVGVIPEDSLREYLDSGEWRGKAGAYNLSERLEAGWPIHFTGDPTSIMGLPMRRLAPILRALTGSDG